jgi:hypothetical protein
MMGPFATHWLLATSHGCGSAAQSGISGSTSLPSSTSDSCQPM